MAPMQVFVLFMGFCAAVWIIPLIRFIIKCCCPSEEDNANNAGDTTTMPSNVWNNELTTRFKIMYTKFIEKLPQNPPRMLITALIPTQSSKIDSFQKISIDSLGNSTETQKQYDYDLVWKRHNTNTCKFIYLKFIIFSNILSVFSSRDNRFQSGVKRR